MFDISTAESPSFRLIEEISFDGDIVVFAGSDLSRISDLLANMSQGTLHDIL